MKNLLIKLVIFTVILFGMDRFIATILQSVRPVDYVGFIDAKSEYFEDEQQYDILLMGDSHISDALDASVLEEKINMSAFNLGVFISSPYETYHTFRYALDHKPAPPKVLVLGTNPVMFTLPIDAGKYTPLVVDDPMFTLSLYTQSENPDYTTFFFKTVKEKYLAKALANKLRGKTAKPYREIEETYHGYMTIRNQIDGTRWEGVPRKYEKVNKNQVRYFCNLIELALDNDVQPLIVNPPIWWNQLAAIEDSKSFSEFQILIDSIGNQYNIPVHNLDHHFLEHELVFEDFLNHEHLNYYGASKYTPLVADWINQNLADQ
ncbi:MAG: hypothetical protein AAFP02_09085 [Bacteroidota bacterium]